MGSSYSEVPVNQPPMCAAPSFTPPPIPPHSLTDVRETMGSLNRTLMRHYAEEVAQMEAFNRMAEARLARVEMDIYGIPGFKAGGSAHDSCVNIEARLRRVERELYGSRLDCCYACGAGK